MMLGLALVESVPAALALLFVLGVSFSLFTASANVLLQLAAPDHLRGRVISLYLFAFAGLAPIGGLVAGWLAEQGGTPLAFGVAGVAGLAPSAWAVRELAVGPAPSGPDGRLGHLTPVSFEGRSAGPVRLRYSVRHRTDVNPPPPRHPGRAMPSSAPPTAARPT